MRPQGEFRPSRPVHASRRSLTPLHRGGYVRAMLRSALLTTRGHIDLLRVASAACRRGR
ncbi:putative leader peptide [Streptomyces narbonensis]